MNLTGIKDLDNIIYKYETQMKFNDVLKEYREEIINIKEYCKGSSLEINSKCYIDKSGWYYFFKSKTKGMIPNTDFIKRLNYIILRDCTLCGVLRYYCGGCQFF